MPAAILFAFLIIRVAAIQAFATKDVRKAAAFWPDHPTVLLESGLAEVGELAGAGKPVDKRLLERLLYTSAKAPLAPEPFLVRGVEAQMSGNQALALRSYLAARERNPRAVAARYFLADLYLKTGRIGPGLSEISALARLVPQSLPQVVPYLAAYAQAPGAAPQLKAMLATHPQLELALLNDLTRDARNADLALYLWSGRGGDDAKPWQSQLLNALIDARRYNEARVIWKRFTGISTEPDQMFDPKFEAQALPPFGWMLAAGPSGIAEPQGGGRLHALYYGREDLVLASQLLTLPPGQYRLSMDVKPGSPLPKSLSWTIRCLPQANVAATVRLDRSGRVVMPVTIPAGGCPAQRLELFGTAPDFPEQVEVTISRLRLERGATQ